jgi:hypothetical protein
MEFMVSITDELSRRANSRSTLLADLQKLYKNSWPPVDGDEIILLREKSVASLAKRFGSIARPMVEAFQKVQKGKSLH